MKQFFTSVGGILLAIAVLIAIIWGGSYMGLKHKQTFGVAHKDADREIFKQSATYNEGKLDDLAKYRLDMIKAEDDVERSAIADMVNLIYANYDKSKIENRDLREFLEDCQNGNYIMVGE